MKILHCIPSMEGGGAERQLTYLARHLRHQGCEVHVALTREGGYYDRLRATDAIIHQLGPCHTHDPGLFVRLVRTIHTAQPDLVQCWLPQMEVFGGLACLATRTPWLFSERSSAGAYPATMKHLVRAGVAVLADGIVANSVAGAEYWKARWGARVRLYTVRNGLPLEEIDAAAAARDRDRAAAEVTILHAGRFDEGKNATGLIRALSRLRIPAPTRALLLGDGPLRAELERLATALGVADRVRVSGFEPNLWGILKSATMFVSLSRFEGSPNVVLEAMACRCPLVVSDIPAHRELLDQSSALFVDSDDSEAVARAMESVVADPVAAEQRAASARLRAESHALPVVAREYLRIYEDVLSNRGIRKRMVS